MKKISILISIILISSTLIGQTNQSAEIEITDLKNKVKSLESENKIIKTQILELQESIGHIERTTDSLKYDIVENSNALDKTSHELDRKILTTETQTNKKLTEVDESIGNTTLYVIIGVLSAILLSIILFFFLRKRQQTDKSDMIHQLSQTKSSIEESLIKEFGKQAELMDAQLQMFERQKAESKASSPSEPDHSLALKLASEITLIERNISLMEPGTKGLKQLSKSVGKLKDNLAANGYEIPELLGKLFNEGLKVIVTNSIPDENLEAGKEIITKVLVPQVNYNDKMIQTAQIEISVGS